MTLSTWTAAHLAGGGHVRRMFEEGQRLRALHGADGVADLSLGQPLEVTEAVRDAFAAATAERTSGRFAYMPNLGYPEVRERCAQDVEAAGIEASSVVMTCGAAGAICLALRTFLEPGSEVCVLAPYFSEYRLYAEATGGQLRVVPAGPRAIDPGALEAVLHERSGAVLLNSPNNPSGQVLAADDLRAVAAVLEQHRNRSGRTLLLVVDEVYRRLLYDGAEYVCPLDFWEHTVLARSFSKDLGVAGERIGYLVVHPSMLDAQTSEGLQLCQRALGYVNAPATAQRALLHLDDWSVDGSRYVERRDLAVQGMRGAGLEVVAPRGGLYAWAPAPGGDGLAYAGALAGRRVLIAPGVAFGVPSHVRVCFSHPRPAIERAAAVMAELAGAGAGQP